MHFINVTGNSVNLGDIGIIVPFLGEIEQELDTELVKKSNAFQSLVLSNPPSFKITKANSSRIEQNLLLLQTKPRTSSMPPMRCLFRGHLTGSTGYAKANRNIFLAMARQGIEMSIDPSVDLSNSDERIWLERFKNIPHPDSIYVHSCIPTFANPIDAKYSVLYTTVESASVPHQFIEACEKYNEVWTTSDFCKKVLLEHGLTKPIFIVPNSVDSRFYNENVKPHSFVPSLKKFRFVSVFSWNYRKGFDVLLKSYLKAFNGNDDVSLLIITPYNLDDRGKRKMMVENTIKEYVERYGNGNHAHIARIGLQIPENEMPRIYKACDAFILPTRGEGFGLPYMEASLCGLPVIATNHSGQTMFLKENNSFLVNIDKLSIVPGNTTNVHYWDGQLFPELIDDSVIGGFCSQMRYVYENKGLAIQRNKVLQDEILSSYSCDIAGAIAKKRLEQIWMSMS